jgi:hypothetical protein
VSTPTLGADGHGPAFFFQARTTAEHRSPACKLFSFHHPMDVHETMISVVKLRWVREWVSPASKRLFFLWASLTTYFYKRDFYFYLL